MTSFSVTESFHPLSQNDYQRDKENIQVLHFYEQKCIFFLPKLFLFSFIILKFFLSEFPKRARQCLIFLFFQQQWK